MTKSKIYEIHYKRFYELAEEQRDKIWKIEELLERFNTTMPSNVKLTKQGLAVLIKKQQRFKTFNCKRKRLGKGVTYYIFRQRVPG